MNEAFSACIFSLPSNKLTTSETSRIMSYARDDENDRIALKSMLDTAITIANPQALFSVCAVSDVSDAGIVINNIKINSSLIGTLFATVHRAFPYIATCGTNLEQWSEQYKNDMLENYWADEIKKAFLHRVRSELFSHIKKEYNIKNKFSAVNPGSLKEWPLSAQSELFSIFGKDYVKEHIGVSLTDSMLMLPSKTVSGIGFESIKEYHNCSRCPLLECPSRQAPYTLAN